METQKETEGKYPDGLYSLSQSERTCLYSLFFLRVLWLLNIHLMTQRECTSCCPPVLSAAISLTYVHLPITLWTYIILTTQHIADTNFCPGFPLLLLTHNKSIETSGWMQEDCRVRVLYSPAVLQIRQISHTRVTCPISLCTSKMARLFSPFLLPLQLAVHA